MAPLWLPLSVAAYAIFSVNNIIDKIIVSKKIRNPLMVSFWVSMTGWAAGIVLLLGLVPGRVGEVFHLHVPSGYILAMIIGGEIILQLGLLMQYTALKHGEATRVVSVVGAATPIFAFVFAGFLLDDQLGALGYASFALLVFGAMIMLYRRGHWMLLPSALSVCAAACMALLTVVARYAYLHGQFLSCLILFGVGDMVYNTCLFIIFPSVRKGFRSAVRQVRRPKAKRIAASGAPWIVGNAALAGTAIVCINLALKYGPAALVNALKGLQYVGVFLIAVLLSRWHPKLLKEELTGQTKRQKIVAIVVITAGLALLMLTEY